MNAQITLLANKLHSAGFCVRTVTSNTIEVFLCNRKISQIEVQTALEQIFDFDPATSYGSSSDGVLVTVEL